MEEAQLLPTMKQLNEEEENLYLTTKDINVNEVVDVLRNLKCDMVIYEKNNIELTEKNINNCLGYPRTQIIKELLKYLINYNFKECYNKFIELKKTINIKSDYLFTSLNGNMLAPSQLTKRLNNVFQKKISASMIRKSFLTKIFKNDLMSKNYKNIIKYLCMGIKYKVQLSYKDIDNIYTCNFSYYGAATDNLNSETTSAMDRIKGYQYLYNIICYRIELLMASPIHLYC